MSNNSMLSNNEMSQPVLSSQQQQQQISGHRARAVSACSASGISLGPAYQQSYSQSYQTFSPIHASWTQTQQGMYMNVYPGTNISEVEDINLNQSGDSYKYQQGVKLSGVPSQLTSQGYHPSSGLSASTHGTLQQMNAQVPFAMAAAPNGLSQAPTSLPNTVTSLRNDPSNMLHSSTPHPTTAGQSLFVHGFVGQQQNVPNQLSQNTLSPSFVTESPAVGPNLQQLGSFGTKHNAQLNGSHNPRALQPTQLSGAPTPATHPSYATALPIHRPQTVTHPSFYPNSTMQQPPPTHLTPSALPHGMVEFLPAMISTDPNAAQNQFNAASFGQYATHYPSAYDPSMDTGYNARVRHNTWAGLEANAPSSNQVQNRAMDPKSFENVYDMTGTLGHNSNNTRVSLASDRMAATLSQRGPGEAHNPLNSNTYNGNSAAQVGSQLPELLEFYGSLPVPDQWLSVCNRYSNSTLPLTGSTRNTKTDERGFEPRISHWNPLPPPAPLATQWSPKPATSMLSSGYKTNTGIHMQNSHTTTDVLGQRRAMDGFGRGQNSAFSKRNNDPGQHKTLPNPRALPDMSGANRMKGTRANPGLQLGKSGPYSERIGSWRPNSGTGGLDGGKPVGHFNPTVDANSNPIPTGVEWNWVVPSALMDQNILRAGQPTSQQTGFRSQDPFVWSTHLTNPFMTAVVPGAIDSVSRRAKLLHPAHHTLPFVETTNNLANQRLADPANGVARFNHGLRLLRDVFPTRILISTALVGAVIGRGGRTIRLITAKTGAQIDFKPQTVLFSQFSLPGGTACSTRAHAATTSSSPPAEKQTTESETEGTAKKNETDDAGDTISAGCASPSQKVKSQANTAMQQHVSPPPPDSEDHPPRAAQLNRSQPVYLFGTREQCSAAVGEILAVCCRECMHGPSAPCLGLLVSHQVYQQLLMGCGRRYFGLLHAATGARVSVTGSPAQLEPIETKQSSKDQGTKKSTAQPQTDIPDRIIVVRGELGAICAAEACISEQVRIIMARDSVPACLWPLIPHLPPLVSSPRSHSSNLAASTPTNGGNTSPPTFDLTTLNRLTLCVALMFWNPTTWNKLISYVVPAAVRAADPTPLQSIAATSGSRSADRVPCGTARRSSDPLMRRSPIHSDTTESTQDHTSLPPPETRSAMIETAEEIQMEDTEEDKKEDKHTVDQLSVLATVDEEKSADSSSLSRDTPEDSAKQTFSTETKDPLDLDSNVLSEKRRPGSAPVSPIDRSSHSPHPPLAHTLPWSTLLNLDLAGSPLGMCKPPQDPIAALFQQTAKDRELLACLQQAIVTAIGPAAWLSTSGLLYMRVSYHEAGALIGTRGCRIRQIMESTGAKIHVGKTRIGEPYASSKPSRRDQRAKSSSKPRSQPSTDVVTAPQDSGDNDDNIKVLSDTGDGEPTDTSEGIAEPAAKSNDQIDSSVICDRDPNTMKPVDSVTGSSPSENSAAVPPESTPTDLGPDVSPVHLAVNPDAKEDEKANSQHTSLVDSSCTVSRNDHTAIDAQNDSSSAAQSASSQTGYRLVTLSGPLQSQLMAHWRIFQCLKSLRPRENKQDSPSLHNTGEDSHSKVASQSNASNAQSHSSDPLRLATLVCVPYAFGSWLTVPNTTFEHPDMPDKRRSNPSALSWLQAEAQRRMQGRYPDLTPVKAICALRKPKPRILARLRRGVGGGPSLSTGTGASSQPPSPVDDVVTALWSDRTRAPIEIYADYETTQFLLGCLHHMHAIWLYGETVVQRTTAVSNQSALLSTPPSRRQQLLAYPNNRPNASSYPTGGFRHALPPDSELGGLAAAATAATGRSSLFDWSPLWCPWWPTDPYGRFIGNPNVPVQLPHPDGYGRFPRVRHPAHATNRWQPPPGRPDRARFSGDSANLLAAMMMMTTTNQRASPLVSSSFAPSLFTQFPPTANGAKLPGATGHSPAGPAALLFNPFPLIPSLPGGPPKSFARHETGTWGGSFGQVAGKPNYSTTQRPESQIRNTSRQPPTDRSPSLNANSPSAKLNSADTAKPTSPGDVDDKGD